MSISVSEIRVQVLAAVHKLGEDIENEFLKSASSETSLIGRKSEVDSITLVSIIVDVEERLADQLGLDVVLADERAMSQKRSPFRTIQTLAEYVFELQQQSPSP